MSTQGWRFLAYREGTASFSSRENGESGDSPPVVRIPILVVRRRSSCIRLLLLALLFSAAGCAGVPPGATGATPVPPAGDDENSGWLFNRLMGRQPQAAQGAAGATPVPLPGAPGVVPASASEPVPPPPGATGATPVPPEDDDSGFEWSDLSPNNIVKNVKKAAGLGPDEGLARKLLDEGKTLYEQKKYSEAAKKYKSAAGRWPDSVLEEDALFWLAECYFFADEYPKAQDAYDNLLKEYDNSRYLDTVASRLFSIGRYWEQLEAAHAHWPVSPNLTDKERPWFDTFGNALKAYETIRMKDPTGRLADDSIMATANAYFAKGRYEDAAYYYDLLRKEYPRSEHQLQAHVLGLQSKLRVYQGNLYDGTPLSEADQIAEQTLTQFRDQLGPEQVRVAQARDNILEQKAERDWVMAQYYDRKKEFGAARAYYQYLIKDYPLTQAAHKARARLDQIRNEPDRPPNRFKWLTDAFPAEN